MSWDDYRERCNPRYLDRKEIQIKLLCQKCALVLDLPEVGTHQHIDNLRKLIIRHFFCQECEGKFIICTCKCGSELGHELVSKKARIAKTSVVKCWPCGTVYHFNSKLFKPVNRHILQAHMLSSVGRNDSKIIESFKLANSDVYIASQK